METLIDLCVLLSILIVVLICVALLVKISRPD